MGLWDSLKKVGVAAKCGVGWHAGDYERVEGKPECFMAKTCPDCRQLKMIIHLGIGNIKSMVIVGNFVAAFIVDIKKQRSYMILKSMVKMKNAES